MLHLLVDPVVVLYCNASGKYVLHLRLFALKVQEHMDQLLPMGYGS